MSRVYNSGSFQSSSESVWRSLPSRTNKVLHMCGHHLIGGHILVRATAQTVICALALLHRLGGCARHGHVNLCQGWQQLPSSLVISVYVGPPPGAGK